MQGTDKLGRLRETPIQSDIIENFGWRRVFCWRSQAIPAPIRAGKKIVGLRKVPEPLRGMPDVMAIINGRFVGIEVKKHDGVQTDEQKVWEGNIKKAGGIYILARSWEDVMLSLIEYGIEL